MKEKRSSGMVKSLSKWNLLSIGIGAVIGWSWVIYAGYWSVTPGTLGGILAFVVAALLCSLVGLVYAELTSAFPKIGVDVSITFLGLGQIPSIIVSWCVLYLWMSFILVEAIMFPIILGNLGIQVPVFGEMFSVLGTPVMLSNVLVAVLFNAFFALINYRGVKLSGWVQTAVAVLTLAALFFCGSGIAMGDSSNAQPLFTDAAGLTTIMLMVPGFLSGFNAIPQAVEETNVSPKTVGRMVLYTVGLRTVLYSHHRRSGFRYAGIRPGGRRPCGGSGGESALRRFENCGGLRDICLFAGNAHHMECGIYRRQPFYVRPGQSEISAGGSGGTSSEVRYAEECDHSHVYHRNAGAICRYERYDLRGADEYRFFRTCHYVAVRISDLYQAEKNYAGYQKTVYGSVRKSCRMGIRGILYRISLPLYTMGAVGSSADRMGRGSGNRSDCGDRLLCV